MVGTEEMKSKEYSLKHMETGEQQRLSVDQLVKLLLAMN